MSVPGTFKNRPPVPRKVSPLIPGREGEWARATELGFLAGGALAVECYVMGDCSVIVALEPAGGSHRWHLSIAHPARYPSWDEIKTAVYAIPTLGGIFMAQILSPVEDEGDWVNAHDNCFHLYEIRDPAFHKED